MSGLRSGRSDFNDQLADHAVSDAPGMGVLREKHGELAQPDHKGSIRGIIIMAGILLLPERLGGLFQRGPVLSGEPFLP